MNLHWRVIWLFFMAGLLLILASCGGSNVTSAVSEKEPVALPSPQKDSETSIEEALLGRRSVRSYGDEAVTIGQLSQLLWAAQGITSGSGGRTAPSAGGLYPLKVYAVVGNVENLAAGVYIYAPATHSLTKMIDGDLRRALSDATLEQPSVKQAPLVFVITGLYEVIKPRYGERGILYTHLEAGHAAQNICLQAVGLKMGVVTIGAFDDAGVKKVLGLPEGETPFYIIPAGTLSD
jgi:SagB-type dehydrogenase family enzyme